MVGETTAKKGSGAISRRTVLGAAVAGGAGVAATRLLGLRRAVEVDPARLTANALASRSGLDWVSPLGPPATAAAEAKVAQLLRRTTFGYTPAELAQATSDGFDRTVDRLIETPPALPPELAGAETASPEKPLRPDLLQTWWIDWMLASPTPFAEKMTLLWHGHFTSEYRKVGLQSPYVYWQNLTWRRFALGDLRSMLYEVTIDPAMLVYLDLARSTARNPNENYARELMELYTMGPEAFTEDDVKAGSRTLTGWREPRTQAMIDAQLAKALKETGKAPARVPTADTVKTGVFERSRAASGGIPFLGITKAFDTQAVIDRILEMPQTARFITRKMLVRFVSPTIEHSTIERIAASFLRSRYDLKTLMRDVLGSPEFAASSAYRALLKSPTEFMVSAAKALQAPALSRLIVQSGSGMGQVLFDPPSVGGWPENESWISSNTMLARINFVTAALNQTRKLPSVDRAHEQFLDSTLSPQTLLLLNEAADERRRWSMVLASPEFQLK